MEFVKLQSLSILQIVSIARLGIVFIIRNRKTSLETIDCTNTNSNPLQMDESELHNTNIRSRRSWDDDFCLKRQFTALIPAFDPRPGRSNVQQIQDIEVPHEGKY